MLEVGLCRKLIKVGNFRKIGIPTVIDIYKIRLGDIDRVWESGFFNNSIHIDNGLFQESSLNNENIKSIVESYDYPCSAIDLYKNGILSSKYKQPGTKMDWKGVVLISQIPSDRSITACGTTSDYFRFIEGICKRFGKSVFIKRHPREKFRSPNTSFRTESGNETFSDLVRRMVKLYDVSEGHVDTSIVDNAERVITYNSTFCVDAALRGKTTTQYAPGYFYKSGLVKYPPSLRCDQEVDSDYMNKFLDFLMWKYCIHKESSQKWLESIITKYTNPDQFPLPMEYSYGSYLNNLRSASSQ